MNESIAKSHPILFDLDKSLEELLRHEKFGLPENLRGTTISFDTPGPQFLSDTPPDINFFLYDIREDRDLRSNQWVIGRNVEGKPERRRAPIQIACSYMVTVWPKEGTRESVRVEHELLSEVLIVLLRSQVLPEETLQGALKNQDVPLPTSALQSGRIESWGEFWRAVGGRPKAALHYTVTISVDVLEPVEAGPPVLETELRFRISKRINE